MRRAHWLLLILPATPLIAQADDYSGMLAYLDVARIDGHALAGANGAIAVNQAAGDLNLQANLRGIATGEHADVSIGNRQLRGGNRVLGAPVHATAVIDGKALAGASGIASINQASGIANTTLNVVSATLARQGIRETDDTALAAEGSALAGGGTTPFAASRRAPAAPVSPAPRCGDSTGSCNSIRSRAAAMTRPMYSAWSCRTARDNHPTDAPPDEREGTMKATVKRTMLAMAIATASTAAAANGWDNQNANANINHTHTVSETRNDTHNHTDNDVRNRTVNVNVQKHSTIQADERKEKNNHGVDVNLEKDLRLGTDINFSGDPNISGDIDLDSAAIAVIDNRQSISNNATSNSLVTNSASIGDSVGAGASGNLGFNVVSGDNNAQDNAASLSAADASFSFGMADAEVFVNQAGFGNATMNSGVTNAAGLGGNAFGGASGNIGVNIASGNNNEQKNALAASVATTAVAQSSISSNQVSTGNTVSNAGFVQSYTDTVQVGMRGGVSGLTLAYGAGTYRGTGNAYQMANYYLDTWSGELPHPGGSSTGHIDLDDEIQNATMNPNRPGVGGLGFDTRESGTSQFVELGVADLYASLSGTVSTTRWVNVNATNTSALSGSAFSGASGNIGVNVAAGTGNLQANSLALAVAQPSTGGGGGSGE